MNRPRLLVAGVSSGVGKTTFTLGLCRALMRRGLSVNVFKCGPDYLDPTYHRVASGKSVHNLDSWLMERPALLSTFEHHPADVSLIEGVMGLFDGASPTELTGSSAEVANVLGAPIVLVCDASGMARSVSALAHGFATFEPGVTLGGLICNRVGSVAHLELLRRAVTSVPVLGGLLKDASSSFPERHLGLQSAAELDVSPRIEAWADHVERYTDVDALLALARSAPPLPASKPSATTPPRRCRIGVADDAAFHFYYEANLRLLEEAGAELVRFSPTYDRELGGVDGVYIGGGYPELHARALEQNETMKASLRHLAASGAPFYAECGGLMYLAEAIVTRDGSSHAMLGLVEGTAQMATKLQALGYVEVVTRIDTPLGPAGTHFRGHQFRYSKLTTASEPSAYTLRISRNGATLSEGYGQGNVLGSYVHAHWSSHPEIPRAFVERCVTNASVRERVGDGEAGSVVDDDVVGGSGGGRRGIRAV